MQTENTAQASTEGFDQMAVGLKTAIDQFQTVQSPESFAGIIAALKPIGDIGLRFWGLASGYVRRHPVQTTVAVVAVGFLIAQLLKPAEMPKSNDGRQY